MRTVVNVGAGAGSYEPTDPERLLDPTVRAAQSAWAFIPAEAVERGVAALHTALASGEWDARYGALRSQQTFDAAVRLIAPRLSSLSPVRSAGDPGRGELAGRLERVGVGFGFGRRGEHGWSLHVGSDYSDKPL